MTTRARLAILFFAALSLILAIVLYGPIPQDIQYHQFADNQSVAGIANGWSVLSNILFLFVGLLGLVALERNDSVDWDAGVLQISRLFFSGLMLTAFGSAYYHLAPTNESLMWDRIPMSISFMAFFCFVLAMHINKRTGIVLLWPLLGLGLASVLYWSYTEGIGIGDLRLYAIVQFLPVALIPMILVMFPTRSYQSSLIWLIISLYIFAKLLEYYDQQLYDMINIGGHTLKHMVASLTGIVFLKALSSTRQSGQGA
jgi:hypothetical protein